MRRITSTFFLAVLAGIFIGIGGTVYLMSPDKTIGSVLFAIGLYAIVSFRLNLFTGKVGFIVDKGSGYLYELLIIIIGNLLGTYLAAVTVNYTRIAEKLAGVSALTDAKLADTPISIFLLAIPCGILMYCAVKIYSITKNPLGILMCVSVFILSGFEHCIANMFYFSAANAWSGHAFLYLMIMIAGNTVGGILIPLTFRVLKIDDIAK